MYVNLGGQQNIRQWELRFRINNFSLLRINDLTVYQIMISAVRKTSRERGLGLVGGRLFGKVWSGNPFTEKETFQQTWRR